MSIQVYDGDGETQNHAVRRLVHADSSSFFNPYAGDDLFSKVDFRLHWKSAEAMEEALDSLGETTNAAPADIVLMLADENYTIPCARYVGHRSSDRLSCVITLRYDNRHIIRVWNQ